MTVIGQVALVCESPALRVVGLLDGPAQITDGGATWEVVDRPGRTGVSVYRGQALEVMTLHLILDGWTGHRSVEPAIADLERMARKVTAIGRAPVIRAEGPLPRGRERAWVISGLVPGENVIRALEDGQRLRQDFTVSLLQYVEADIVVERSPALRTRERKAAADRADRPGTSSRSAATGPYVVRAGDTLAAIAARRLGDFRRWNEIADLNGIRDPRRLKVGQELKLP